MKELLRTDLEHVQDDLGILRVVLVPAIVQGLARSGQSDGRDERQLETSSVEMVRQRSVVVEQ